MGKNLYFMGKNLYFMGKNLYFRHVEAWLEGEKWANKLFFYSWSL